MELGFCSRLCARGLTSRGQTRGIPSSTLGGPSSLAGPGCKRVLGGNKLTVYLSGGRGRAMCYDQWFQPHPPIPRPLWWGTRLLFPGWNIWAEPTLVSRVPVCTSGQPGPWPQMSLMFLVCTSDQGRSPEEMQHPRIPFLAPLPCEHRVTCTAGGRGQKPGTKTKARALSPCPPQRSELRGQGWAAGHFG